MKIRFFILFFLIAALLSAITHYGVCKNNYDSYAHLIVNYSYAARHNPPTFTGITAGGTDVDFPLFATTDIWVVYSDLGVKNTRPFTSDREVDDYTQPPITDWLRKKADENQLYVPGKLHNDEGLRGLFWDTWTHPLTGKIYGSWNYVHEYKKIFGKSAYAYVSCNIGDNDYQTTFNMKATVPPGYCTPHERDLKNVTKKGYFSHYVFPAGNLNGWDVESSGRPTAEVSAEGINLLTKRKNKVDAEAPTSVTAVDLDIICDFCNSNSCEVCDQHRKPPWE